MPFPPLHHSSALEANWIASARKTTGSSWVGFAFRAQWTFPLRHRMIRFDHFAMPTQVHLTRARQTILSSCPPQWFSTSSATSTSAILASILKGRPEDQHCYGDDSCHPTSHSPSPSSNDTTAQFPSADRHRVDAAAQTLAALISQAVCAPSPLLFPTSLDLPSSWPLQPFSSLHQ
jgi:hypothetical protein